MEISQRLLGMLFVWAVLLGFALGGVYDVLRITRILCGVRYAGRPLQSASGAVDASLVPSSPPTFPRRLSRILRTLLIFAEDLLFGVVCGISLIILLYYTNDGQFRALSVCGMACGFFAYYHTLGRLVMLFSEVIVSALRRLVLWIVHLALLPFRWLTRLLYRTVGRRITRLAKRIRHKHNVRYTNKAVDECVQLASRGFGLLADATDTTDT